MGSSSAPLTPASASEGPSALTTTCAGSRIFDNDNWQAEQAEQIAATALAPSDPREAAMIATLPPGAYTAVVRGAYGLTGVALIEAYYVGR